MSQGFIWSLLNSIGVLGALVFAALTFFRTEARAKRQESRILKVEQREAVNLKIVLLEYDPITETHFLGVANHGTETVSDIWLDPESVLGVGIGGATH